MPPALTRVCSTGPRVANRSRRSAKRGSLSRRSTACCAESDFVSLHSPLNPSTRHQIGARELKLMKKTAYLINTARGPIVDEAALIRALRTKQIAGAGLDVFEYEPKVGKELRKLNNVVLTPHRPRAAPGETSTAHC